MEPLAVNTQVRYISADREGNLWIGTNGDGLLRFRDRPIHIFSEADGLPNNIPMTVLQRRDGSVLWLLFIAPEPHFNALEPTFQKMIQSLRVAG